jgi:hypothetical protein
MLGPRTRSNTGRALVLLLLAATPAAGQSSAEAADAFDRGVKHFQRAEYELAARSFARADELVPAPNALKNAIAAARKAGAHLLVAELAERAERRAGSAPELAAQARAALAEASLKLARLELDCAPPPCVIVVDDERVETGTRFVLPGIHTLSSTAEGGARAEERMQLAAGATYRIVLHPVAGGAQPIPAQVSSSTARGAAQPAADRPAVDDRPLSPAVFWIGAAASLALAGVTTWSGLDALSAKRDLPKAPSPEQSDTVRAKVLRTDLLLAGTLLVGGLTAYAGFSLVDWRGGGASAVVAPLPGGAYASAVARF